MDIGSWIAIIVWILIVGGGVIFLLTDKCDYGGLGK